jgi:hypothetical protein
LGDADDQIMLSNDGIPVPELRTDVRFHWDSAKLFDQELPYQGCMVRCATGNQKIRWTLFKISDPGGHYHDDALSETCPDGIGHGPGLLKNLFKHEVLSSLFRHQIPVNPFVPLNLLSFGP